MSDKPLVIPSDVLQPDIGRFGTPMLSVDQDYQIGVRWPDGEPSEYVQMVTPLFLEWVAMLNAQRRLLDLLTPAVDAGVYWPGRADAETEIADLKRKLRFG